MCIYYFQCYSSISINVTGDAMTRHPELTDAQNPTLANILTILRILSLYLSSFFQQPFIF